MSNLRSRNPLFSAAGIILVLLSFSGLFVVSSHWSYEGNFWKGWYPVLIPSQSMNAQREESLMNLGSGLLISETTSTVEYNSYNHFKRVSLKDLRNGDELYPSDPRYDPYMKGVQNYFNQGIYKIFYLPSSQSPLKYSWQFSRSEKWNGVDLLFPDAEFPFVEVLLFSLTLILLCWKSPGFLISGLAFFMSGFQSVMACESQFLLILAVTALFISFLTGGKSSFKLYWILPLLPACMAVYGDVIDLQELMMVVFILTSTMGSCLINQGISLDRTRKSIVGKGVDHVLFEPVSLLDRKDVAVKQRISPLLLAAALAVMVQVLVSWPGMTYLPVPIPSAQASGGQWDALELNPDGALSTYPDTEDFLRHKAFQESFMYGGSYLLPRPGSTITLEDFAVQEGRITETSRTVLEFDSSWFETRLAHMMESGPALLLRSEDGPPIVLSRDSILTGIRPSLLLVLAVLIVIYVLIQFPGIHPIHRNRIVRGYGKSIFVLRRKQQAA
jgi:hypothetical protein